MKARTKSNKICVLGGGLWGTVLANHLARKGHPVCVWEFFRHLAENLEKTRKHPHLTRLKLAESVRFTHDLSAAARDAETILIVLPSAHVRSAARGLRACLAADGRLGNDGKRGPWVINASKGVERRSLRTMGEVVEAEIPSLRGRVYTLSGPSFAREVARNVPTALVLAGPNTSSADRLRRLLEGAALRVERSADRKGVELCGSLKNVVAIGCGVLDGLGAGANTKAAFMTEGIAELGRLIAAAGGRTETAYGLAGIGDLIATGTSSESRNRGLGEMLGAGKGLRAAMREIPTVAEGVDSAHSAHALARSLRTPCPVLEAIWRVVHRGAPPRTLVSALGFKGAVPGQDARRSETAFRSNGERGAT